MGLAAKFQLGIVAAPVGMLIRRRLEETLTHASSDTNQPGGALKAALTTHLKLTILRTFAELGGPVLVYIPPFFLPSYAVRALHLSSTSAVVSGGAS
jgi:MHS family proline/betaine transporter-like MFS transporter